MNQLDRTPCSLGLCLLGLALIPVSGSTQETPADLLDRAIAAAGGAGRLAAFPALEWDATAVVHVPGRDIEIAGRWRINPPESAVVSTYPMSQGPGAIRRLILAGDRGWSQVGTDSMKLLPAEFLAEERHQFYLYSLLRLLPLRDSGVILTRVPPDSLGKDALRVTRAGHPDVTLYFDADARIRALRTIFAGASGPAPLQEIVFTGTIEVEGVRWFRSLRIRRDRQPYFDLTLTALRPLARLEDSLLAGPP